MLLCSHSFAGVITEPISFIPKSLQSLTSSLPSFSARVSPRTPFLKYFGLNFGQTVTTICKWMWHRVGPLNFWCCRDQHGGFQELQAFITSAEEELGSYGHFLVLPPLDKKFQKHQSWQDVLRARYKLLPSPQSDIYPLHIFLITHRSEKSKQKTNKKPSPQQKPFKNQ